MKYLYFLPIVFLAFFACTTSEVNEKSVSIPGLQNRVEVVRDSFGVAHIYAENEHDLFFAQGYSAARDRLFQFEVWRMQSTGTAAEVLGERELNRDVGVRLFKFRGNMDEEMNHYHPRGKQIIEAYVDGVNAYIDYMLANPAELPIEFRMLDILPQKWTPEVVISRHQGLLGNIGDELNYGRAVAKLGAEEVIALSDFEPGIPDLSLDKSITSELLEKDLIKPYNDFRRSLQFQPEDVAEEYRAENPVSWVLPSEVSSEKQERFTQGSNNWIISGDKSATGFPMLANDPHRTQAVPSLRYIVHLVAPGWNVIGGGEPEIPGISIGHNEYGAWGLTVFGTDAEDLMIYELNPENPEEYKYKEGWKAFEVVWDTIPVKGRNPEIVKHRYSIHGPVTFHDPEAQTAAAMRCGWLEVGGSPYLASLMMDQATNWEEFRQACNASHIPGENMIWADKEGTIGWQAVGIAPIRKNFSGMVPVPGDGRYEWEGYLAIVDKPHLDNPPKGYFATANENVIPKDYPENGAIGYEWADKFRGKRIEMVLSGLEKVSMDQMAELQTDYYAVPASILVPIMKEMDFETPDLKILAEIVLNWDFKLEKSSVAAAIYVQFEKELRKIITEKNLPGEKSGLLNIPMTNIVNWVEADHEERIGDRTELYKKALQSTLLVLNEKLGNDKGKWQYGQEKYKHILLRHPLSAALNKEYRAKFEAGPVARGGYSYTVGATGGGDNQTSGASFRLLINTGDWDETLSMNNPGQSGNISSPFYKNLFKPWADDGFFPLYYSRAKIDMVMYEVEVWK